MEFTRIDEVRHGWGHSVRYVLKGNRANEIFVGYHQGLFHSSFGVFIEGEWNLADDGDFADFKAVCHRAEEHRVALGHSPYEPLPFKGEPPCVKIWEKRPQ